MAEPLNQPLKSHSQQAPRDEAPVDEQPAGHTLADICRDCVLFTPALVVAFGGFDRDPVAEYVRANNVPAELSPSLLVSPMPFFEGIPASLSSPSINADQIDWNHRLYLVPHAGWEDCREFIARMAIVDRSRRRYSRVLWYELQIVDYFALARSPAVDKLPTVPVTVFASSTNRGVAMLDPAIDPPRTYPSVAFLPPEKQVVAEHRQLLMPHFDPLAQSQ